MNLSDISEMTRAAGMKMKKKDAMAKKKQAAMPVVESSDDDADDVKGGVTVEEVPTRSKVNGASEWIIKHSLPQHHSQCGTLGPCDSTITSNLPPRRRFNIRDQLQGAAKAFTLEDLGFDKGEEVEPEDTNRNVSCYAFVTLGARLMMAYANKASVPTCILTLPPVSTRGSFATTSASTIKANLNSMLVSTVFTDTLHDDIVTTLSASIHHVPLGLYLRSNKITEVSTKGSSSADVPNQLLRDVLHKYVVSALLNDSEITAGGQGGESQTLFWEFTGFSVSVLGHVDLIRNDIATTPPPSSSTPLSTTAADMVEGSGNAPPAEVTTDTPAPTADVVAVAVSPVDETPISNTPHTATATSTQPSSTTTTAVTPSTEYQHQPIALVDAGSAPVVLSPNPPSIPLGATSPKERPRISTPDLIDGKASRLVKELKEIQDLRDLRGRSNNTDGSSYLMTPGGGAVDNNSAHLRRVSPLLNRLKDNAKGPVPDNCAYKSIIDTHRGRLLAPHTRQSATSVTGGGGEDVGHNNNNNNAISPMRQESPPRGGGGGGLFSTMWAHRANTTTGDGDGGPSGRGVYDAIDANQTYPSASTSSSRRAEKGGSSTNVSPSRHQQQPHRTYHPGHTSGDGTIGTPLRGATTTTTGESSRLTKLIDTLNGGS